MIKRRSDEKLTFSENDPFEEESHENNSHDEDASENHNKKNDITENSILAQATLSSLEKIANPVDNDSHSEWFEPESDHIRDLRRLWRQGKCDPTLFDRYGNYYPSSYEGGDIKVGDIKRGDIKIPESSDHSELINTICLNLRRLFKSREHEVMVFTDLFWYPSLSNPKLAVAPDIMVIFGRPQVSLSSYVQVEQNGIAPQVVFEIVSKSNAHSGLETKRKMYERFGVEEYYEIVISKESQQLQIWIRDANGQFILQKDWNVFFSPRIGISFQIEKKFRIETDDQGQKVKLEVEELVIRYPDGKPFAKATNEFILSEEKDKIIKNKDETIKNKDEIIKNKDETIKKKDETIKEKENLLNQAELEKLRREALIQDLTRKLKELENLNNGPKNS